MKSIKRSLQESRLNTHRLIRAWLQPRLGEVGNRFRLGGRIRLANRWARKHPRRTFACVVGSLAFLLAGNIAGDVLLTGNRKTDEAAWTGTESLNGIALVEPMFQGFRTIQANKNVHRTTLMELTGRDRNCGRNWIRSSPFPVKATRTPSGSSNATSNWNTSSNH